MDLLRVTKRASLGEQANRKVSSWIPVLTDLRLRGITFLLRADQITVKGKDSQERYLHSACHKPMQIIVPPRVKSELEVMALPTIKARTKEQQQLQVHRREEQKVGSLLIIMLMTRTKINKRLSLNPLLQFQCRIPS